MESGWRHLVNSFWRQPVASMGKASAPMSRWFQTPVGSRMLDQELGLIEQCRKEYKGQVMLQVSSSNRALLGSPSRKRLKITVSPGLPKDRHARGNSAKPGKHTSVALDEKLENYSWLASSLDALPLEEGSVDFLVLHHSLEFSEDPHAVLREAVRVLAPQGHMIIISFNPYSLFGLRKSMQLILRKTIPWAHHGLSRGRISDWLKLMSCEPLNAAWGFYSFPVQSERLLKYSSRIDGFLTHNGVPGGGFYVIHASKEVDGWVGSLPARDLRSRLIKFPAAAATKNFKESN